MDTHEVVIEIGRVGAKAKIEIDGQEIKYVQEIKFEAKAGNFPVVWIKLAPVYNIKIKSTDTDVREILASGEFREYVLTERNSR